jgi:terminase small subunit / prophage DNA-packing protein
MPTAKGATKKRPRRKATKKTARVEASTRPWHIVDRDQLGALFGVHADTISDFTRQGMPVLTRGGRGQKSEYDAILCLAWFRSTQGLDAKEVAQARSYAAAADVNELRAAKARGELVSQADVIMEGQSYTKAWAAKVAGLPRQLVLAGVVGREMEDAIAEICRALLTDIAEWKTLADLLRATGAAA